MQNPRPKQVQLFDVGNVYPLELKPSSFFYKLAIVGREVFKDEDFEHLYDPSMGRPCVPPSLLALVMLMQYKTDVSDVEAIERTAFDLRWAAVLEREAGTPLCARTTLVHFRARLVLAGEVDLLFDRIHDYAKRVGMTQGGGMKVVLDTRPIVGRGSARDTFNLIADVMGRLIRLSAQAHKAEMSKWARARSLLRYVPRRDGSFKGSAGIDWADPEARDLLLTELVADARRLIGLTRAAIPKMKKPQQGEAEREIELLERIIGQDVEETVRPNGSVEAEIREGTSRDRIPSSTDPDQRHGRKSSSRTFLGHKLSIVVEPKSQLIVDVDVIPGNAADAATALDQVQRLRSKTTRKVRSVIGDCAYGAGAIRQQFQEAGIQLYARTPRVPNLPHQIHKQRFKPEFEGSEVVAVTCPARETTRTSRSRGPKLKVFEFGVVCRRCPLRHKCIKGEITDRGRTVQVNAHELLLHNARELQRSSKGKEIFRQRAVVEHALARMAQLGSGQARYFGRPKTRFQMLAIAAAVNLNRIFQWQRQLEAQPPKAVDSDSPAPGRAEQASTGLTKHKRRLDRPGELPDAVIRSGSIDSENPLSGGADQALKGRPEPELQPNRPRNQPETTEGSGEPGPGAAPEKRDQGRTDPNRRSQSRWPRFTGSRPLVYATA